MRYLISGGRFFNEEDKIRDVIDEFDCVFDLVIHGNCYRGADEIADRIATGRDMAVLRYPAKWVEYGEAAGNIRNQQMIDEGKPNMAYCFWDGRSPGTGDMIERLLKHRIKHVVVAAEGASSRVSKAYQKLCGPQGQLF